MISEGYKLPFFRVLDPCFFTNSRLAELLPSFFEEAIIKLLGAIASRSCVNPLSVARGRKLRLVIDLLHVNTYLFRHSFKYEDLHSLSKVFEHKFWFFTSDLESGYHHVDIFSGHQKFLGFSLPLYSFVIYLLQPLTLALEFFYPQISQQPTMPSLKRLTKELR